MWGNVSCLRQQPDDGDWASNHWLSDMKFNVLTTTPQHPTKQKQLPTFNTGHISYTYPQTSGVRDKHFPPILFHLPTSGELPLSLLIFSVMLNICKNHYMYVIL